MTPVKISRRDALTAFGGIAISACLWRQAGATGFESRDRRHIIAVARQLYPHDNLDDDVYVECMKAVDNAADADSALEEMLQNGLAILNSEAGGDWLNATNEEQIAALKKHEDSNFFLALQNTVRTALYGHPAVWTLIGYEGSSVEFGGYLERGFDDIDWLPEP